MNRSTLAALSIATLFAAGCANYDTRLNDAKTSYLGTDGSIISRSRASTLADKNSYWVGDGVE
jgi:outer membrane murein-binding lipoprotein Lpp